METRSLQTNALSKNWLRLGASANSTIFETGANLTRPLLATNSDSGYNTYTVSIQGGVSGFSAYGNAVTIAIGGLATPTNLTWGTAGFAMSTLVLNAATANTNLTLANAMDLNGTNRAISVNAAVANVNGSISSSSGTPTMTKGGAGTLNLNAVNTYAGATFVTNGTLGGTGSLTGPLNIQSGAVLKPGIGIGTFTVSNAVTLGGSVVMELNQTNLPNCDQLMATTIACGGALVVTNLGPALTNQSSFRIFSGTVTGAFSSTNLPPLGPNLIWSNSLAANGTLTVLSTMALNPTNLSFQLLNGGTILQLSWPADHIGWSLQSQTNSLTSGLGTNWVAVAGSALTNQVSQAIGLANGSVFFRLVSP